MKNRYIKISEPKQRRPLSLHMQKRLHEGWFLICVMGAIFLLIALLTYHANDPGWSSSGLGIKVQNWGGRVGAWIADMFLSLFGLVAYFFPPLIVLTSFKQLKDCAEPKRKWHERLVAIIGGLCIVLSLSALLYFYIPLKAPLPAEAGGIVGDVVGSGLALFFNRVGSTLLFITLFLCGITLVTGLSWLGLLDFIGEYVTKKSAELSASFIKRLQAMQFSFSFKKKSISSVSQNTPPVMMQPVKEKSVPVIKRAEPVLNQPLPIAPLPIEVTKLPPAILDEEEPALISREEKSVSKPKHIAHLPDVNLLNPASPTPEKPFADISFDELSQLVEQRLADFGVDAKVVAVHPGPVITRFELDLAPGIKVSKIVGLAKDIARSLSTVSVRIVEVIPGKSVIGLEIPNENRELVTLREMLESDRYQQSRSPMTLILGKDIAGYPVVVDLGKMPHLLVAGTTGSGKSVSINAMLLSMLYKATPETLRFIMIDPKMLELSIYDGIPHLLTPVITDMKNAANALRWCVAEMDKRYRLMAALGVRNLASYNQQVSDAIANETPIPMPGILVVDEETAKAHLKPLPAIVVVVDELADMMMVVGKKVEDLIARIAQKARAAGIHLILATQRPSVDVITGLIKANIPTRVAFQVSSRIDSRTILDQQGAEQLLGHGDMLYLPPGAGVPTRVHGAYVADDEVHRVVAAWRACGEPEYIYEVTDDTAETASGGEGQGGDEQDALYDDAVRIVTESRRASISLVQRRLRIGYNRAARIMEEMEAQGIVSEMDGSGTREVLANEPSE